MRAMLSDPVVMADQGGPVPAAAADAKRARYEAAIDRGGDGRWAVETHDGDFVGYVGTMPNPGTDLPLGPHREIGWRLVRACWRQGFASEAARAALVHSFALSSDEVLAYTAPDNHRSQAVMARLGLRRDPTRDFTAGPRDAPWHGLVWVATGS